jgi:hypothetical protein
LHQEKFWQPCVAVSTAFFLAKNRAAESWHQNWVVAGKQKNAICFDFVFKVCRKLREVFNLYLGLPPLDEVYP